MLTRRELLERGLKGAAVAACGTAMAGPAGAAQAEWVNDVHSKLNPPRVCGVAGPASVEALQALVRRARDEGRQLSIAGGRHAMGGQQFGSGTWLVDTRGVDEVVAFDTRRGTVEVGAGIQWPALVERLDALQPRSAAPWTIAQKQTGADRLCLGGSLAANAHGRGLAMTPIVGDVESFTLVDASGELRRCSRRENAELFRLAIGGYGLFGVMATVELRLARRRVLERVVELVEVDELMQRFDERIADGFLYGDFQYATASDEKDAFLRRGVFSCYRPAPDGTPIEAQRRQLSEQDWRDLVVLAHVDRSRAFRVYADHYLSTSGQIYASDTHQMSTYVDDYHDALAGRLGPQAAGSEMISELYVPRDALVRFLDDVREDFRRHRVEPIYGTIRLIERDRESFLAWARQPYACVIFNLHVPHQPAGLARAQRDFRRLIDRAIRYDGSYFLTYHRWAGREQVLACHPRLPECLRQKRRFDPQERFTSDWYRHQRRLLAG